MKHLTITFAIAALMACSGAPSHTSTPESAAVTDSTDTSAVDTSEPAAPVAIPDSQLGLSKTSVFDVPDPAVYTYTTAEPGGNPREARAYYIAPPVIPHQVADFLPITIEENGCLACHELGGPAAEGEPTPLPPSHATDLRNAPDKVGDELAGARWRCVACHVPKSDAPPLVGNDFRR